MPSAKKPTRTPPQSEFVLVLSTAGSPKEAQELARRILEEKLAGCINLVPKIRSMYWWKGRVEEASEVLLLIKTRRSALKNLSHFLKRHHSYELPELIALPILWGDPAYLKWLRTL